MWLKYKILKILKKNFGIANGRIADNTILFYMERANGTRITVLLRFLLNNMEIQYWDKSYFLFSYVTSLDKLDLNNSINELLHTLVYKFYFEILVNDRVMPITMTWNTTATNAGTWNTVTVPINTNYGTDRTITTTDTDFITNNTATIYWR